MNLPIFFVHQSNPLYLSASLSKARDMNPGHEVILLGDYTNQDYKGISHYLIRNYKQEAEEFANHYIHRSPNSFDYELFCFQRWFIIHDFIKKERPDIKEFIYLDSDAMMFVPVKDEYSRWKQYKMTLTGDGGPCYTYFNIGVLDEFIAYINYVYCTEDGRCKLFEYSDRLIREKKNYGVSDMTAFMAYGKKTKA